MGGATSKCDPEARGNRASQIFILEKYFFILTGFLLMQQSVAYIIGSLVINLRQNKRYALISEYIFLSYIS